MTITPDGFACELDATDRENRASEWKTLADLVLRAELSPDGFRVAYAPAAEGALRALVQAERACCSWASWACLSTPDAVVLEVTGPKEQVAALANAFGVSSGTGSNLP